jgi:hypothetical protein
MNYFVISTHLKQSPGSRLWWHGEGTKVVQVEPPADLALPPPVVARPCRRIGVVGFVAFTDHVCAVDPVCGLEQLLLLVVDEKVVAGTTDAAELVLLEGEGKLLRRALGANHLKEKKMIIRYFRL